MSDKDKPSDLAGLDARLKEARVRQDAGPTPADDRGSGIGMALRMGTELVAGVFIGVGIGWFLDRWLGTRPWLMIAFAFIGFAAGVVSMYRTASGMGHAVGYRKPGTARGDDDKSAS